MVDSSAGFGDGITFGLTKQFRELLDVNGSVNTNSNLYQRSEVIGNIHISATGSVLLLSGLPSSTYAALAISAQGASVSASNLYFNSSHSGSLILDSANIGAGFLFGSSSAGRVAASIVNFQTSTTSFAVSN